MVETYWKSTSIPKTGVPRPWSVFSTPQRSPGSTFGSPSSQPVAAKIRPSTISSITGDYVYVVVQLTQDMQPVAFPYWKLPEEKFDLHVPDLTLAQFDKLAIELGRNVDLRKLKPMTTAQWYSLLKGSMLSLAELLSVSNSVLRHEFFCWRCDLRSFQTTSACASRLHAFPAFIQRHPIGLHRTSMLLSTPFFVRSTRDGPITPETAIGGESCSLPSLRTSAPH